MSEMNPGGIYGSAPIDLTSPGTIGSVTPGIVSYKNSETTLASSRALTLPEMSGGQVNNYGQGGNCIATCIATQQGMNGTIVLCTTAAFYYRIAPASGEIFYLDGVALSADQNIGVSSAAAGNQIQYEAVKSGASTYQLYFSTVSGPWAAI